MKNLHKDPLPLLALHWEWHYGITSQDTHFCCLKEEMIEADNDFQTSIP